MSIFCCCSRSATAAVDPKDEIKEEQEGEIEKNRENGKNFIIIQKFKAINRFYFPNTILYTFLI